MMLGHQIAHDLKGALGAASRAPADVLLECNRIQLPLACRSTDPCPWAGTDESVR